MAKSDGFWCRKGNHFIKNRSLPLIEDWTFLVQRKYGIRQGISVPSLEEGRGYFQLNII